MTTNTNTAPALRSDDVRATIGSGRSVHRAFAVGGPRGEQLVVSCGAASRAGGSRIRPAAGSVTCRKCLAG